MDCALTLGRNEPCKEFVGGLKSIYFINYGADLTIEYDVTDTDVIDELVDTGDTASCYKYDLKGSINSLEQTVVTSRDNGTTYFEQVLNLTLKGLTKKDHKELRLLSYGRPHVIVETNQGDLFYCGLEHGMDVTGGTVATGAAMGDTYGYTLTMTGMEKKPANFLIPASGSTTTAKLEALGLTIVVQV